MNWNWNRIRELCIRHNYYTKGDCEQYDNLWEFVTFNKATGYNIKLAAMDIVAHSDGKSIFKDEDVDTVVKQIEEEVLF